MDEVIAGVLPDGKEAVVRRFMKQGKVAMVGDGINDAPALTRADIGVAIGAGADVAIDAADVVLMKSRLSDVPAAIRLSRATLRNIHENLFWAFFYNTIGIPWPRAASSGRGLRSPDDRRRGDEPEQLLRRLKRAAAEPLQAARREPGQAAARPRAAGPAPDAEPAEAVMYVDGMMCEYCERAVKEALEGVEGVLSAEPSHEEARVRLRLSPGVDERVPARSGGKGRIPCSKAWNKQIQGGNCDEKVHEG